MRTLRFFMAGMLLLCLWGCQGGKSDEGETLKTTAPINNNAPEAKNAPAAPRDPSIIMPGGGKGNKQAPGGSGG